MAHSFKYSNLAIRLSLAAVFLWFGIEKFVNPDYWIGAWLPQWIVGSLQILHMTARDAIYLNGIFEVLVGVSLVSGFFMRAFAGAAAVFLVVVVAVHGLNEILVRDLAILGGCLAVILWPDRRMY